MIRDVDVDFTNVNDQTQKERKSKRNITDTDRCLAKISTGC